MLWIPIFVSCVIAVIVMADVWAYAARVAAINDMKELQAWLDSSERKIARRPGGAIYLWFKTKMRSNA